MKSSRSVHVARGRNAQFRCMEPILASTAFVVRMRFVLRNVFPFCVKKIVFAIVFTVDLWTFDIG